MSSSDERLYQVTGNLVTFGKKHIVVRDPIAMTDILKSSTQYAPVGNYSARSRDEEDPSNVVTFFKIFVLDKFFVPGPDEKPKLLDVQVCIPEQFTNFITLSNGVFTLDPKKDRACQQYIQHLNDMVGCWFPVLSQKRDNSLAPVTFRHLNGPVVLKWPWKKESAEEYADRFSVVINTHVIMLGVGYHNAKSSEIGISLNLSQYPGLTYEGVIQKMNSQKKRRITRLAEDGTELGDESVEPDLDQLADL